MGAPFCYPRTMNTQNDDTVGSRFFSPLAKALEAIRAESQRQCPVFTDMQCLRQGIGRVLETVGSGRDWVQSVAMSGLDLSVGTFFNALRSRRRTDMVLRVCRNVRMQADDSGKFWGLSPKLSLRGVGGCGRVVQMNGDAL